MSYLLDTNVISELTKKHPDQGVINWINSVQEDLLFLSVFTIGELTKGVEKLPDSTKKDRLLTWLQADLEERFYGRVLPFSQREAILWGKLTGKFEKVGAKLPIVDSLIAAVALANNSMLVTRNTKDYEITGVQLFNPWTE
jgi:predicted nucleic acid-binding protein